MKKSLYTLLFLLVCAYKVAAVSAFPYPVTITQPDGSSVTVIQKGDEHVHWMETTDGITLLRNSKGFVTYATTDDKGNMVASDVVAQDADARPAKVKSFLSAQSQKVFFSQLQLDSLQRKVATINNQRQNSAALPTGTGKILVILMGYSDIPFSKTTSDFNNMFNQAGYNVNNNKSSVNEFFTATSYGKFTYTFDVKGPYTAKNNRAYYGKDIGTAGNDQHPDSLVQEAIRAVHTENPSFSFSGYSAINVIFAGNGQEFTGVSTDAIWSHQSDITPPSYCPVSHYLCTAELYSNTTSTMNTMGVLCHELTHVIGAPDYYDTNYNNTGDGTYVGTGQWDLMADGSWNRVGTNLYGTCPPNMTMYQKERFGWVTPTLLTAPTTVSDMAANGTAATAYRFNTSTPGEYYLLENRQQSGYDSSLPGHGLIIYHVAKYADDLYYDLNITAPQKMYPVCASATTNPSTTAASYGTINSGGCPFPGTSSKTSFTDSTTPYAKSWSGENNYKPVTGISENTTSGTISFNFMSGVDVAPAPLNLQGTTSITGYALTWNAPSNLPVLADTIVEQHWDGASVEGVLSTGTAGTLSCEQVFSIASLTSYVGKKWTGVKFFPTDASATSYHIQIYDMTTSGSVLSDQSISGVTANVWNEFSFSNPLTIQANKNYGIAVQYTSPTGTTLSVDRGPKTESNGNYGALLVESGKFYTIGANNDYNFNVRGLINIGSAVSYNVYQNGTKIANVSSPNYTVFPATTGTYCVKTVNNGTEGTQSACIDYIAPIYTDPVIFNIEGTNPVYVYGIPSGVSVYAYSPIGKMIKSFISNGNAFAFSLPTGVWLIKAGSLVKKVIVK